MGAIEQRKASLKRAGAAYRQTHRARRLQATKQARYRERLANFQAQIVTHQPLTQTEAPVIESVALEITSRSTFRIDEVW